MASRLLPALVAVAACGSAGGERMAAGGKDRPPAPSGGAADHAAAGGQAQPSPACPLSIAFGSYAMGIDRATFAAVESLLAGDPAVLAVERQGRGREGETRLCARVRSPADAERLFRRIAALLPADPRGPIDVATATGLTARAPAARP